MLVEQEEIPATGHAYSNYADANDGTHSRTCANCGDVQTEAHSVSSYKTDGNNLTHTGACDACGASVTENHSVSGGTCSGCGAAFGLKEASRRQTTVNGTTPAIMFYIDYTAESADNLTATVTTTNSDFSVFGPSLMNGQVLFRLEAANVTSGTGSFTVTLSAGGNTVATLTDSFELKDESASTTALEPKAAQPIVITPEPTATPTIEATAAPTAEPAVTPAVEETDKPEETTGEAETSEEFQKDEENPAEEAADSGEGGENP